LPLPLYNEKELLLLITEGDEAAFREIFQRYGDIVHANIYAIIKSQPAAEDLVQDTFLRVWLYRDKLPEIENFRSWLLRISYNRAFTYLHEVATQQRRTDRYGEKYGIREGNNATEEAVQLNLLKNIIRETVHKLPKQQKKIYQLSREHGLKIPEIAAELGIAESSVKNTLGRALQALRQAIEKAGFGLLLLGMPWLL